MDTEYFLHPMNQELSPRFLTAFAGASEASKNVVALIAVTFNRAKKIKNLPPF